MLQRLRAALGLRDAQPNGPPRHSSPQAPLDGVVADGRSFALAEYLHWTEGLPHANWDAVRQWVDALPASALREQAWADCERVWLAHLGRALGPSHVLQADGRLLLLSSLEPRAARVTIDYVRRTRSRVLHVLNGVASDVDPGHVIVILFDDEPTYYRYVSPLYPEAGEFGASGGMCIDRGCVHFVSVKNEQHLLEPVVAHETTHAMLSHLPIPLWLNEGLAVNTERRLCPSAVGQTHTGISAQQMHNRHRAFWRDDEVQQFWSGESFGRADHGQELSYDLARILVEHVAADWARFAQFVNAADATDAGDAAAKTHLGLPLGAVFAALLEREDVAVCSPRPEAWGAVASMPASR